MKTWVLEQVVWAEKNLKGKTGVEKRAAVVLLAAWREFGLWYAGVDSDFRWFRRRMFPT